MSLPTPNASRQICQICGQEFSNIEYLTHRKESKIDIYIDVSTELAMWCDTQRDYYFIEAGDRLHIIGLSDCSAHFEVDDYDYVGHIPRRFIDNQMDNS